MNIRRIDLKSHHLVGIHEFVEPDDLHDFFGRAFAAVAAELRRAGLSPCGPPVGFYQLGRGGPDEKMEVTAGFPVEDATGATPRLALVTLPGGPAAEAVHIGPYDRLHETYAELTRWIAEHGHTPGAAMWEQYVVGPDAESDPARWRTLVVFTLVA